MSDLALRQRLVLAAQLGDAREAAALLQSLQHSRSHNNHGHSPESHGGRGGDELGLSAAQQRRGAVYALFVALVAACGAGALDVARLLLAHGAPVDTPAPAGDTPLTAAVRAGSVPLVELLLEHRADPGATASSGEGPIGIACRDGALEVLQPLARAAIARGRARSLLGARREQHSGGPGSSGGGGGEAEEEAMYLGSAGVVWEEVPLLEACTRGHTHVARWLLFPDGRDGGEPFVEVDKGDVLGETALFHACAQNRKDMIRLLVDAGASREQVNTLGQTAFLQACRLANAATLRFLAAEGFDTRAAGQHGRNGVFSACQGGRVENVVLLTREMGLAIDEPDGLGVTPFMLACDHGHVALAEFLVRECGVDKHRTDRGGLNALANYRNDRNTVPTLEVVRFLAGEGVDLDRADARNRSALHFAATRGEDSVVVFLASQPNVDVNRQERMNGHTPLLACIAVGMWDVAMLLASHARVDVGVRGRREETPLAVASARGMWELTKVIAARE